MCWTKSFCTWLYNEYLVDDYLWWDDLWCFFVRWKIGLKSRRCYFGHIDVNVTVFSNCNASFIFVMYREGLSGNILLGMFFAIIIGVMAIFFKASEANVSFFGWVFAANYLYLFVIVIATVLIHFGITYLVMPRYRAKKYIINMVE